MQRSCQQLQFLPRPSWVPVTPQTLGLGALTRRQLLVGASGQKPPSCGALVSARPGGWDRAPCIVPISGQGQELSEHRRRPPQRPELCPRLAASPAAAARPTAEQPGSGGTGDEPLHSKQTAQEQKQPGKEVGSDSLSL